MRSGRKTHRIEIKPRKNCCHHLLAAGPIAELRTKALRKERDSIALGRQYSHVPKRQNIVSRDRQTGRWYGLQRNAQISAFIHHRQRTAIHLFKHL